MTELLLILVKVKEKWSLEMMMVNICSLVSGGVLYHYLFPIEAVLCFQESEVEVDEVEDASVTICVKVIDPTITNPIAYPVDLDITFTSGTAGMKLCTYDYVVLLPFLQLALNIFTLEFT